MNYVESERINKAYMAELIVNKPELIVENQAWLESKEDDMNWDGISNDEKNSSARRSSNDDEVGHYGGGFSGVGCSGGGVLSQYRLE